MIGGDFQFAKSYPPTINEGEDNLNPSMEHWLRDMAVKPRGSGPALRAEPRYDGANGMRDIEGKAATAAARKCG